MTMLCDARGSKGGSSWMSYYGMSSNKEEKSLRNFIVKKTGKEKNDNVFELCGNCAEELKKIFSQELKEEIIQELAIRKSIDCYFSQQYLLGSNWGETKSALVENIKSYKNEWEIEQKYNYNKS